MLISFFIVSSVRSEGTCFVSSLASGADYILTRKLLAGSQELYSVYENPFDKKRKSTRCGVCDLRFYRSCVQISESDQVFFPSTGKSSYPCVACSKLTRSTGNDDTLVKPLHSLLASDDTQIVSSPQEQLNLSEPTSNKSLSVQK